MERHFNIGEKVIGQTPTGVVRITRTSGIAIGDIGRIPGSIV